MAFDNVRNILRTCSPFSSYKLLLTQVSFSRPLYRGLCRALLNPWVRDGDISLRYQCYGRRIKIFLRLQELESDLCTALELCIRDAYDLEPRFMPDVVVDGGGNIGLFTLRASALVAASGGNSRFVICEPMPENLAQIEKNMNANNIQVEILPVCLGGATGSIPFYCREAIQSSFDPTKPYDRVIEMPVKTLKDVIGTVEGQRILIKLDIEGMEVETLRSYIPSERRPVYIVGELHDYKTNLAPTEKLFNEYGWAFEVIQVADDNVNFRGCSPAAFPLLASMSTVAVPLHGQG
jgi:FkbM family methyltransferase